MERYERVLRWRADGELEEARAEFWINIAAAINESKSCKSDTNRDTKEIQRDWKLTDTELEASIY